MQKNQFKIIISLLFIFALFVVAAYFAQQYNDTLVSLATGLGSGLGIAIYIAITIASVIVPPFSSAPLIPLAANTWGFFLGGNIQHNWLGFGLNGGFLCGQGLRSAFSVKNSQSGENSRDSKFCVA